MPVRPPHRLHHGQSAISAGSPLDLPDLLELLSLLDLPLTSRQVLTAAAALEGAPQLACRLFDRLAAAETLAAAGGGGGGAAAPGVHSDAPALKLKLAAFGFIFAALRARFALRRGSGLQSCSSHPVACPASCGLNC